MEMASRRPGRKTSVYVHVEQAHQMEALGVSLAQVVRAGLEALATAGGLYSTVVELRPDGRYELRREAV
jgi:hypothetical protein